MHIILKVDSYTKIITKTLWVSVLVLNEWRLDMLETYQQPGVTYLRCTKYKLYITWDVLDHSYK